MAQVGGRRARRLDPERRSRIIDAALEVIALDGVAGTSHRKVAARADVPLGSMTYHFSSMDELLLEALTRFAARESRSFREALDRATTEAAAQAAVVGLITREPSTRDLVLTHEIYTLAARKPEFRRVTREWMTRDQAVMEEHFDPVTARVLNVLIEGLTLHRALDTQPQDDSIAHDAVAGVIRAHTSTTSAMPVSAENGR